MGLVGILLVLVLLKMIARSFVSSRIRNGQFLSKGFTPPSTRCKVSILVPAWNDADVLPRCLDSLRMEMCRSSPYETELIVIAGGHDNSYDTALHWAQNNTMPHCVVIQQLPRGKNFALNQGLTVAAGEVVIFVDADTQVLPGWLTKLVQPIVAGDASATTAQFMPFRQTPVSRVFVIEQFNAQELSREGSLFGGGTIAVDRTVLQMIGGLVDTVLVGVDWDLTHRLRQAGFRTAFVPAAQVQTEIAHSWREFWLAEVRWRRGWWVLQQKSGTGRLISAYALAMQFALLLSIMALGAMAFVPYGDSQRALVAILAIMVWVLSPYFVRLVKYARAKQSWSVLVMGSYLASVYISSAALVVGVMTAAKLTPHFKGPRPGRAVS